MTALAERAPTPIEREFLLRSGRGETKGRPEPPGRSRKYHEINWGTDVAGWSEVQRDDLIRRFTRELGMRQEQARNAVLALMLEGYKPDRVSTVREKKHDGTWGPRTLRSINEILGGGVAGIPTYADFVARREEHKDTDPSLQFEYFRKFFNKVSITSLRIVFPDDIRKSREYENQPDSIESLAFQLIFNGTRAGKVMDAVAQGEWAYGGIHSLFGLRMKTAEEKAEARRRGIVDESEGEFEVKTENLYRYVADYYEYIYYWIGPDSQIPFDDPRLDVIKRSNSSQNFDDLFFRGEKYFYSEKERENGVRDNYLETNMAIAMLGWSFQNLYKLRVDWENNMFDMGAFIKWAEEKLELSPSAAVKLLFGLNMMNMIFGATGKYTQPWEGQTYMADPRVGRATAEMVLAYNNLRDYRKLRQILPASFFTIDAFLDAGVHAEIQRRREVRIGGGSKIPVIDMAELYPVLEQAFDLRTRQVRDEAAFIRLINVFGQDMAENKLEWLLRAAVQTSVAERYGISETLTDEFGRTYQEDHGAEMSLAEHAAWSFNRIMGGGAKNDVNQRGPTGNDILSRMINFDYWRWKQANLGNPHGRPGTIFDGIRQIVTAPGDAIRVEESRRVRVDEHGRERVTVVPSMSIMSAIELLHSDSLDLLALEQAHAPQDVIDRYTEAFRANVGNLFVPQNAMRFWSDRVLQQGYKLYKYIMEEKKLDLDSVISVDPFGGVTLKNKEKFNGELGELLHHFNDSIRKYPDINLAEEVSGEVLNPRTMQYETHTGPRAFFQYGIDTLDREEFWAIDPATGKPMVQHVGGPLRRFLSRMGLGHRYHVIDPERIQANKEVVVKSAFMREVAEAIAQRQKLYSGDAREGKHLYLAIADLVIDTMSGPLLSRELAKHGFRKEHFFNKADKRWLKTKALNCYIFGLSEIFGERLWMFYLKWWITSLIYKGDKDGLGISKALGIIISKAFEGANL